MAAHVCVCMYVKIWGQPQEQSFFIWRQRAHWTWSSLSHRQGPGSDSPVLASISTETINVRQLAWLFMWVLRIELKVLLFTWLLLWCYGKASWPQQLIRKELIWAYSSRDFKSIWQGQHGRDSMAGSWADSWALPSWTASMESGNWKWQASFNLKECPHWSTSPARLHY